MAVAWEHHRYLVIGAGPAGLQLGYFLTQAGADCVVLEREQSVGSFFRTFPRHRRLISLNKVHNVGDDPETALRWDWNSLLNHSPELLFGQYSQEYFPSAEDLVRYLEDFQREHRVPVRFGAEVQRVERHAGGFRLYTGDGGYECECLVVATGWAGPYLPDIDGIEHAVGYEEMSLAPEDYRGQRVLVIGKGNSAFETAHHLLPYAAMIHLASPTPLRLAWNTKHPGHVRGMYGALLDSYQFKTLHSVLDCHLDRIRPTATGLAVQISYTHADGERELLEYDKVLRCTGFVPDLSFFDADCRPRLSGRLPDTGTDWQSTSVDGVYFAGTLAQVRDHKRASSAFIDGFRYNLRTLTALLRERYEGVALERATVPAEIDHLTGLILDRVNWSSALWTQFEYLCDALVVDPDAGVVHHYQDLPEDYAVERFAGSDHCYTVGLRWGREDYRDVFAIERHPVPERAAESAFIHPVVRRYRRGRRLAEVHLLEDLLAQWRRPDRHVAPLRVFLATHLADLGH